LAISENYFNTPQIDNVASFMLRQKDELAHIGSIPGNVDPHVYFDVSNILTTYISNIDDNTIRNLSIGDTYSVYVIAIDEQSNWFLFDGVSNDGANLTGLIEPRPAPTITSFNIGFPSNPYYLFRNYSISYDIQFESDVYFKYYIATFEAPPAGGVWGGEAVKTFFQNHHSVVYGGNVWGGYLTDNPIHHQYHHSQVFQGNVSIGFDGFGYDEYPDGWEKANVNTNQRYNNVDFTMGNPLNPYDYTPWIDRTKPMQTWIYAINDAPHDQGDSIFLLDSINHTPLTATNTSITSIITTSQTVDDDTYTKYMVNIDNPLADTVLCVAVLYADTRGDPYTNINTSGAHKYDFLYRSSQHFSVTGTSFDFLLRQFYDRSTGTYANIEASGFYYTYFMTFNPSTGEASDILVREHQFGHIGPYISYVKVHFDTYV
jgi:hypothetical protein